MQGWAVIVIIAGAIAWLGWHGYRFWRPARKGGCAGGCCSGDSEPAPAQKQPDKGKGQTVFLPAEDLVRRIQARR